MKFLLVRLFRVIPEESSKLLAFITLAALLQAGLAIGIASSDALFLAYLGAEKLPLVYIFLPLVTLSYAPLYSVLLSRLGIDRLFVITLVFLGLGGVGFGYAFNLLVEPPAWLLFACKFYTGLWFIALYTLFWNFADDYFAILDGKRLFGIIAAGSSLGAMLGAMLVSGLSQWFQPGFLFFAWSALALLALPALRTVKKHPKLDATSPEGEDGQSAGDVLRKVGSAFRSSRFAFCLALVCFLLVNLGGLLEFLSYGVFQSDRSAADLATMLGNLYATAAAATLVINLLLFSRIVGRIGVNNTALIVPLGFLGAFVWFYLDYGIVAALVAFYVCQSLFVSIEYNNINLLFNGLPSHVRKHLRTFIEALGEPMATAFAGLFLLGWAGTIGVNGVAIAGMLIAVAAVVVALVIRNDYANTLAKNLRLGWLDFSPVGFSHASTQVTDAERTFMRQRAKKGDRVDRLFAIELLWKLKDPELPRLVLDYLPTALPADTALLSPILSDLLRNPDNTTLAEILLWLEREDTDCPSELMGEFLAAGIVPEKKYARWLRSDSIPERALVAIVRWHNPRLDETQEAITEIRDLMQSPGISRVRASIGASSNKEELSEISPVLWAIRALGDFRYAPFAGELLPWMMDPDGDIRMEALRSLAKLAPGLPLLPSMILDRLEHARDEERQWLIRIIGVVADTHSVIPVFQAASIFTPTEMQMVEDAIAGMGSKSTPAVVRALKDPGLSFRSRGLAARVLERIAPPQLQTIARQLIHAELTVNPTMNPNERLDFTLELLSLSGLLPDLELIRTSLRQPNQRDRANAVETIQQNIPHDTFQRIQPLIAGTSQAITPSETR
jgi:MFS family permease